MRKQYVENLSFYKLLEVLNDLPVGSPTTPYYYKRQFNHLELYCYFIRDVTNLANFDYSDPLSFSNDEKKEVILIFFFVKPRDVRRSSLVRPICQISLELSDFTRKVFEPQIRTVRDFLSNLDSKTIEINTAIDAISVYDTPI